MSFNSIRNQSEMPHLHHLTHPFIPPDQKHTIEEEKTERVALSVFINRTYTTLSEFRDDLYLGVKEEEDMEMVSEEDSLNSEQLARLDPKTVPVDQPIVLQKAQELQSLMPEMKNKNELIRMSAFIEKNREELKALAEQNTGGFYLRREVSGLPLSLLITPEGRFIWETKKKARSEDPMGGYFKKLYKCVDHDEVKLYVSGTMKVPRRVLTPQNEMVRVSAHKEIEMARAVKNLPHVVQALHSMYYKAKSFMQISGGPQTKIKVITEYFSEGDLKHILQKQEKEFSTQNKEQIIQSLIEGVVALHEANWIHGDIKPDNIFFDEQLLPHIGDFGCMHPKSEPNHGIDSSYQHPQFNEQSGRSEIREKQDMFALGLTLLQLEMRKANLKDAHLFQGKNDKTGLEVLYKGIPEDTAIQKFIKKLINPELASIPTAKEAQAIWEDLQHTS